MAQSEGTTWQLEFAQCGLGQKFRALVTRGHHMTRSPGFGGCTSYAKSGGFGQIWRILPNLGLILVDFCLENGI
jgi:hypothetical protein